MMLDEDEEAYRENKKGRAVWAMWKLLTLDDDDRDELLRDMYVAAYPTLEVQNS